MIKKILNIFKRLRGLPKCCLQHSGKLDNNLNNIGKNMEVLRHKIFSHLETSFEKDLFNSAFENLYEKCNKLRLNNFSYAMRELTRHFLSRLAPDKDVLNAPWFIPNDPEKPKAITREQRIRYAITGYLSSSVFADELNFDFDSVSKDLRKSINDLSKYTHINPDTFNVSEDVTLDLASNVLESTLNFFDLLCDAKIKINKAIYDAIDEDMVNQFYMETFSEIDMLATHHEVLCYAVTNLKETNNNGKTITIKADGHVNVRLQYGSDGDVCRGDGWETEMSFPFTSETIVNYQNQKGDIHIEKATIEVDNNAFFE